MSGFDTKKTDESKAPVGPCESTDDRRERRTLSYIYPLLEGSGADALRRSLSIISSLAHGGCTSLICAALVGSSPDLSQRSLSIMVLLARNIVRRVARPIPSLSKVYD